MENHICKKCGGIAGWDPYFQSWICTRCGNNEPKPKTNGDRLRASTDEELARRFATGDWSSVEVPDIFNYEDVYQFWLNWLKQEVDGNGEL
jgi:hypothetical protein